MSTNVEAPAPRNLAQETSDTLETTIRLAPDQLAAYQQTAPGYAQTDVNILGQSLFGSDWTGNLGDINRRLTTESADQTRAANTAQRAADIDDVARYGGAVQAAQRSANQELFGNLDRLDAAAAGGQTAAESRFISDAMGAGSSQIEKALEAQALRELSLGDQLSADEARQVRVQSRAAADARGRGFSNAALADEVLNTANARQSRLDSRRNFAGGVNTALRAGQSADRSFLGQAAGMESNGFQRLLGATQARMATFTDPFQGVLGRASSNAGNNSTLFGNAQSTAGNSAAQTRGMFDPFNNAYAQDLYSTNYNAEAAAKIATANNKASLIGAGIGAAGMAAGGFLACWLARAVYGPGDARWQQFRRWLLSRAPDALVARYLIHGRAAAARAQRDPVYRAEVRALMDQVLALA
jgi:hypothetical protein